MSEIQEEIVLPILQASIDIYAMGCVLSRCSISLNQGVASARHEELIAKVLDQELC